MIRQYYTAQHIQSSVRTMLAALRETGAIHARTFASVLKVLSMKTQAAEQVAQLQAQHDEMQSLKQTLESAITDRDASQRSVAELSETNRNELAQQRDTAKKLQQTATDAQTKLSQLQSDRAEEVQLAEAQTEAACKHRQEVSDVRAQLKKAEKEVASLEDTRTHLQQQLGERTIVLGQKAHQIAHLTAQLNEARALSSSSPGLGEPSLPFCVGVWRIVSFSHHASLHL